MWRRILPHLGGSSPEVWILGVGKPDYVGWRSGLRYRQLCRYGRRRSIDNQKREMAYLELVCYDLEYISAYRITDSCKSVKERGKPYWKIHTLQDFLSRSNRIYQHLSRFALQVLDVLK